MAFDIVQLAVIQNGLRQIATEMDLVHEKAAFSPVISEAFDRSNGIYHRHNGEVVAQGAMGLPLFVGVMQFATRAVIELRGDLDEGDIVLFNDPYLGGTHLMDVKMMRPFHYRGKLWCYLSNTGHWPDTGGMVPGGFATRATEVVQEGLRIPPVKLLRRGVMQDDILQIVLNNIRVSEERIGDIKAQIGALSVGERRLTQLLDRYGADTVDEAIRELKRRSALQMRAHIRSIPDGEYRASAFLDSDGVEDRPLEIKVCMSVRGDELGFSFAGSSPPCRGPLNGVWACTQSAVYVAVKHVFPDVPVNAGCFEPIRIEKPVGTFLCAEYPRPVAGCASEVAQRVIEAVFGAFGAAMPERMFAAPAGTSGNLSIGGHDPRHGRDYIMYFFSGGGYGGSHASDGLSNGCSTVGISKTQPIEILEQYYPVVFDEYALNEDSAGAGKHRGGFGVRYRVRLRRGEATASFLMDHGRFGPPGLVGGAPGALNEIEVCQGTRQTVPEHTSKGEAYTLQPGDSIVVRTPGGGGWGDPHTRDPALVRRDAARGYFTDSHARTQDAPAVQDLALS
jgi:N-methylhydantoinase B